MLSLHRHSSHAQKYGCFLTPHADFQGFLGVIWVSTVHVSKLFTV